MENKVFSKTQSLRQYIRNKGRVRRQQTNNVISVNKQHNVDLLMVVLGIRR